MTINLCCQVCEQHLEIHEADAYICKRQKAGLAGPAGTQICQVRFESAGELVASAQLAAGARLAADQSLNGAERRGQETKTPPGAGAICREGSMASLAA